VYTQKNYWVKLTNVIGKWTQFDQGNTQRGIFNNIVLELRTFVLKNRVNS